MTDPDREITGGGDFAAGLGPTHYGSGPLPLQAGEDVVIDNTAASATTHTFTVTPRGGPTFTRILGPGGSVPFRGIGIQSVSIDAADSHVLWTKGPAGEVDVNPPSAIQILGSAGLQVPQTSGGSLGVDLTGGTTDDAQNFGPSTIAQSALTVQQAGASTVPPRHFIYMRLACGTTPLAVAADVETYCAVVGHTSAVTYGIAFLGQVYQSHQQQVLSAEKLDLVTANADTGSHAMWGSWWSVGST